MPQPNPGEVSEYLRNTTQTSDDAAAEFHIGEIETLDIIANEDEVDRCEMCHYWCDKADLVIKDSEYICRNCREEDDDG